MCWISPSANAAKSSSRPMQLWKMVLFSGYTLNIVPSLGFWTRDPLRVVISGFRVGAQAVCPILNQSSGALNGICSNRKRLTHLVLLSAWVDLVRCLSLSRPLPTASSICSLPISSTYLLKISRGTCIFSKFCRSWLSSRMAPNKLRRLPSRVPPSRVGPSAKMLGKGEKKTMI